MTRTEPQTPWYTAAVVGAGPAGSAAAEALCRAGVGPVLLLDRASFPRLKTCAGGISPAARQLLKSIGVWDAVSREAYPIRGARLMAPSGRDTLLEGAESSLVLSRDRLDELLKGAAVQAGATFRPDTRIRKVEPAATAHGGLTLQGDVGPVARARWVIVATGANRQLTGRPTPRHALVSIMGWYRGLPFRPHTAELYFDRELRPHYGWLFPEAPDRVNIGLCCERERAAGRPLREVFQDFLDRHFTGRMAHAEPVRGLRGHPIAAALAADAPAGPPGLLPVGEACGLANRATGEGISFALSSGQLAATVIHHAEARHFSTARATRWYGRLVHLRFDWRLRLGALFARAAPFGLEILTRLGRHEKARTAAALALAHL